MQSSEVVPLFRIIDGDLEKNNLIQSDQNENLVSLDPPASHEEVLGPLSKDERTIYIELASITGELEGLRRELMARAIERGAKEIRSGSDQFELTSEMAGAFHAIDEAEYFYSLVTRYTHLRGMFDYSVKSRYGFAAVYGVRSNFALVRVKYRYERGLPDSVETGNS